MRREVRDWRWETREGRGKREEERRGVSSQKVEGDGDLRPPLSKLVGGLRPPSPRIIEDTGT